jgi:hypothetical protein
MLKPGRNAHRALDVFDRIFEMEDGRLRPASLSAQSNAKTLDADQNAPVDSEAAHD